MLRLNLRLADVCAWTEAQRIGKDGKKECREKGGWGEGHKAVHSSDCASGLGVISGKCSNLLARPVPSKSVALRQIHFSYTKIPECS